MKYTIVSIVFVTTTSILLCDGVSLKEQLEHIVRRIFQYDFGSGGTVLGVPTRLSHLPRAEPILPGHTLLKPALVILKSAVKFPHRELENGAGVYGHHTNIGIRSDISVHLEGAAGDLFVTDLIKPGRYDGRNERLLYSGFRRTPSDYIMIVPTKSLKSPKPSFLMSSMALDLDKKRNTRNNIQRALQQLFASQNNKKRVNIYAPNGKNVKEPRKQNYYLDQYATKKKKSKPNEKKYLRSDKTPGRDEKIVLGKVKPGKVMKVDSEYQPGSGSGETSSESEWSEAVTEHAPNQLQNWFWNSKDLFNHIQINDQAPAQTELIPENISRHLRNWWYYNQDDLKPFINIEQF